jgi:hypothetical protein
MFLFSTELEKVNILSSPCSQLSLGRMKSLLCSSLFSLHHGKEMRFEMC